MSSPLRPAHGATTAHEGTVAPEKRDFARMGARVPLVIGLSVAVVLIVGTVLVWRAEAKTNKVALASSPKHVSVSPAEAKPYRPIHTYVGALRPWIEAKVGPQYISAYVETVLVRPGAVVNKGDVLATLDCRYPTAETAAIASKARAIAARQAAAKHEAERTNELLDGGFVSVNESEMVTAKSASEAAELASQESTLQRAGLDVSDCILRAPFDGEISQRLVDPGSFVRPNTDMIGVVDRRTVRMTADAPESDFNDIAPGTSVTVHVVSINLDVPATISRRSPNADPGTRTVHFEVDIANDGRRIPVDTTGEVHVAVGQPVPATAIPLKAVTMKEEKATLFVVEGDSAKKLTLKELGEAGPDVYFAVGDIKPDTPVVVEGRALLKDGDRVTAKSTSPPKAEKHTRDEKAGE
jgi:membrane fusion protein, multidrug efflux system